MEKKKRYLLNCEVCDARKMHENLFDTACRGHESPDTVRRIG